MMNMFVFCLFFPGKHLGCRVQTLPHTLTQLLAPNNKIISMKHCNSNSYFDFLGGGCFVFPFIASKKPQRSLEE